MLPVTHCNENVLDVFFMAAFVKISLEFLIVNGVKFLLLPSRSFLSSHFNLYTPGLFKRHQLSHKMKDPQRSKGSVRG